VVNEIRNERSFRYYDLAKGGIRKMGEKKVLVGTKFDRQVKIPKVQIDPEKRKERDLQMVANYFEVWKEMVAREFGRAAADKLGNRFGEVQGEISGKIYKKELDRRGIKPEDPRFLEELLKIIAVSAELMGEDYNYFLYGPKKAVLFTAGCATLREQYDKSGKFLEHPPYDYRECIVRCDGWSEFGKWITPKFHQKRIKNVVDDGICAWEYWMD
jgi:hypothetical protein